MKYLACLLTIPLALAGFVLADTATPTDPLDAFRRDRALVQVLVTGGLELAAETDPVRRAAACNRLAEQFSREIKDAAASKNGVRALALAQHLKAVLVRGVAFNAGLARSTMPDQQKTLEILFRDTERMTVPADEGLKLLVASVYDNDWSIVRPLEQGRAEVQRAVYGERPVLISPGPKSR